jgi:hypothetical protein
MLDPSVRGRRAYVVMCCFAAVLVLLALISRPSQAAYIATGKIEGGVCTNYLVLQNCGFVKVDAVEEGGSMLPLKERFETVSDYSEGKGLCWINLKHKYGWISWIWQKVQGPQFYTKMPDEKYEKVNPEYLY